MTAVINRRHLYSIVRLVPEPRTGEFINFAALALDPESGQWALRRVANDRRALRYAEPYIVEVMHEHLNRLAAEPEMSETRLMQLYGDHRNIVQYSEPGPASAESPQAVVDMLFHHFFLEK